MILSLAELAAHHGFAVRSVLHLGAHLGEERDQYDEAGAAEVVWVEANPEVCAALERGLSNPGHRAIQAVIADAADIEVDLYVTNNRRSSSLLPMHLHAVEHPGIVVTNTERLKTTTVDALCARAGISPDLLVLDLQGAELLALRGASQTLARVTALYTEVSTAELFRGCALLHELDEFLDGFVRVDTVMTPHQWGEALYLARRAVASDTNPRESFSPSKGRVFPVPES
jgi:FkbM family methyltransferase